MQENVWNVTLIYLIVDNCIFLFVGNAMKDSQIDSAVRLRKKLVAYLSHSRKRKRELAVAQKELNLPEHQLKTECPTRYGPEDP